MSDRKAHKRTRAETGEVEVDDQTGTRKKHDGKKRRTLCKNPMCPKQSQNRRTDGFCQRCYTKYRRGESATNLDNSINTVAIHKISMHNNGEFASSESL
jgi:hypothetical protein